MMFSFVNFIILAGCVIYLLAKSTVRRKDHEIRVENQAAIQRIEAMVHTLLKTKGEAP